MARLTETEQNHETRLRNLEATVLAQQAVLSRFLKNLSPAADEAMEYAAQYFVNAAAMATDPADKTQKIKALEYVDLMRSGLGPLRPVKEME
jgi:hypothetical protein